ncbi:hypothetical protein BDZ45DRAFT_687732 [Acephala macrosclerotiorum]|nr:hypothetical protein BDZ45DRAFT_687732 [Acephala macrosclerotiorum]
MKKELLDHCPMDYRLVRPRLNFTRFFMSFPPELRHMIIDNIQNDGLTRLARTSKSIHAQVIPTLYRKVELSVHNQAGIFPGRAGMITSADNPDVNYHSVGYEDCVAKELSFLYALRKHPEYGTFVQDLRWASFTSWVHDDDPDPDELIGKEET